MASPRRGRGRLRLWDGGFRRGQNKEMPLPVQLGPFFRGEDPDLAELTVKTTFDPDLPLPHPPHPFGRHRTGRLRDLLQGGLAENVKLRAQVRNKRVVEAGHFLGLGADPQNLSQNLGQAEEALKRSGPWRLEAFGPVSQSLHPVEHADGDRLAADRAESRTRRRLPGFQANLAGAVAVQMILALLRKEFQGPGQSLAGAQGGYNLRVTQPGLEHGRLTGQVGRGVGVGGGDQMEAVQGRDPPVHGRIRAEARLSGVDVAAQILEALNQIVEARLGAQDREPGRPDVGRDQLGQGVGGQNQLQDVLGVQTQNGPAVRGQVAAGRQGRAEPLGRLKRGHQDDDVDFAHPLVLFVNTGDFAAEQEADFGLLPLGLPQGEEAFF